QYHKCTSSHDSTVTMRPSKLGNLRLFAKIPAPPSKSRISGVGKVPRKCVLPRFGLPYTTILRCSLAASGVLAFRIAFTISSFVGASVGANNADMLLILLSHNKVGLQLKRRITAF